MCARQQLLTTLVGLRCPLVVFGLVAGVLLLPAPPTAQANEPADVAYAKGILAYDQRNYLEALEHFRQVVALRPDHADAQFYLGLSLSRVGEFAEAITALETARRLKADLDHIDYHLGLAYFYEGRFTEALAAFEAAAQQTPHDAPTQFYLGYTHAQLQQYNQALPFFQRAVELDASLTASAQYYRGAALYALERDAEARQAFEAAIAVEPEAVLAQNARRYLRAIDNRSRDQQLLQLQGVLGYQFDDNVVLADDDIISRESDGRVIFGLIARLTPVRVWPWRLGVEYALFQSLHFELSEFDIQSHTARLFGQVKLQNVTLRGSADYNYTTLGASRFSEAVTVTPSALIQQSNRLFAVVSVRYRNSNYFNQFIHDNRPDVRDRDGWSMQVGAEQYLRLDRQGSVVSLGYHFEASRNEGSDWEYDSHTVHVGLQAVLLPTVTLHIDGSYMRRDYLHVNSFDTMPFGVLNAADSRERQDDRFTAGISLAWAPVRYVIVSAGFSHTTSLSNIDFFAYDRNIFSLAVTGRY